MSVPIYLQPYIQRCSGTILGTEIASTGTLSELFPAQMRLLSSSIATNPSRPGAAGRDHSRPFGVLGLVLSPAPAQARRGAAFTAVHEALLSMTSVSAPLHTLPKKRLQVIPASGFPSRSGCVPQEEQRSQPALPQEPQRAGMCPRQLPELKAALCVC